MSNADQAEFWSGAAGRSWVAQQSAMDALLAPVLEAVLDAAAIQTGEHVLDIGCGTGASTFSIAQRVGSEGSVLGADISPTLLTLARTRLTASPQAKVREADAAEADLGGPFDVCVSRFGVMFFQDTPAAFRNIARSVRPGGRFALAAWASAGQNPYFMQAAAAARSVFSDLPKVDRSLPGPFAFEDPYRVRRDFTTAGLREIEIQTLSMDLTPHGTLSEFVDLCMQIGPAASAADKMDATDAQRAALETALAEQMQDYVTADGLRVPALIHIITARV